MPEIEIGMNRRGEYAILKIKRSYPVYSEEEIDGLPGYVKRGIAHIPAKREIVCGKISKEELKKILGEAESSTNISKLKL